MLCVEFPIQAAVCDSFDSGEVASLECHSLVLRPLCPHKISAPSCYSATHTHVYKKKSPWTFPSNVGCIFLHANANDLHVCLQDLKGLHRLYIQIPLCPPRICSQLWSVLTAVQQHSATPFTGVRQEGKKSSVLTGKCREAEWN